MAESLMPLPRSGWMQLQPAPTRHSSVTEEQELSSVPMVARGACFRLGFHSHTVIRVHPAKLPTLCECIQKPCPAPGQALPGTAAALPTPGCSPRAAPSALGRRGEPSPGVPSSVTGTLQPSPAGPEGTQPGARLCLLPLCRPWPLAGGPGDPQRRCPLLGPHRATASRRGGWGWGAAPSPDCPASLPGSSPSGSRPSLAAGGDLPCLGDSEGAAAGENPPAPPAAEGGKGKGARGAPPESRPPLPACRSPVLRGAAPASARPGCPGRLPSTGPGPARPAAPALRRSRRREAEPDPPAQPRGDAAEGAGSAWGGPAGRERWARMGTGQGCAALVHSLRRFPAAHLSGEGGREPGSALPFPRPPRSVPAARSRALPKHGARSAPPASPLPPEGTGQGCPHTPPRGLWLPLLIPSLLLEFPLSYVPFSPPDFLSPLQVPRLAKRPRHIQHAITGTASLHSFPHCCPQVFPHSELISPSVLIFTLLLSPPYPKSSLSPQCCGLWAWGKRLSRTIVPLCFEVAKAASPRPQVTMAVLATKVLKPHPLMAALTPPALSHLFLLLHSSWSTTKESPFLSQPSCGQGHHKHHGRASQTTAQPLARRSSTEGNGESTLTLRVQRSSSG